MKATNHVILAATGTDVLVQAFKVSSENITKLGKPATLALVAITNDFLNKGLPVFVQDVRVTAATINTAIGALPAIATFLAAQATIVASNPKGYNVQA